MVHPRLSLWPSRSRRLLVVAVLGIGSGLFLLTEGRLIVTTALLLFAPGYLIERRLAAPRLPLLARLVLWLGLSLSIIPLVYQWLWVVGLPLSTVMLWLATGALAAATLWGAWRDVEASSVATPMPDRAGSGWMVALTLALLSMTFWNRFVDIADLRFPPWVDSVHHALLVRIAAETGAVPLSLEPYLPVRVITYHWGYHVVIATLLRLNDLPIPTLLLLTGQILNALNALAAAGLALTLWRRPLAAPVAALITGLVSIMPAYYLSWGRYTQLTGLLMLCSLAIAWETALRRGGRGWRLATAIVLAGLSLVHVRMLIFGVALVAALSLVWALDRPWAMIRTQLLGAAAAGLGAVALAAPWQAVLVVRALLPAATSGELVGSSSYNALNQALLWTEPNRILAALALAGAWLGIWRRERTAAALLLWVGFLVLATNPWLITYLLPTLGVVVVLQGLLRRAPVTVIIGVILLLLNPTLVSFPYLWLLPNDTLVISLFLPFALLIGGGAALSFAWLRAALPRFRPVLAPGASVLLLAAGLWSVVNHRSVVNPATVLVNPGEPAALAWVAAETPPNARFLINAAPWMPGMRRGVDGGWWLLPLTGRQTSTPPVLYVYGPPDYVARVNAVTDTVIGYAPGREQEIFNLIAAEDITHIYLVEGVGPLTPDIFAARPGFVRVYERDGVTIFAVVRGV